MSFKIKPTSKHNQTRRNRGQRAPGHCPDLPGSNTSFMVRRPICRVYPRGASQDLHFLSALPRREPPSWVLGRGPLPGVPQQVVEP